MPQGLDAPLTSNAEGQGEAAPAPAPAQAFVQGQSTDFGADDSTAYGQTLSEPGGTGRVSSEQGYDTRSVNITLGKKRIFLGLQQPLYTHIDTPPAKILKILNVGAAILLIIGGFDRFLTSWGGSVVQPECNTLKFRDKFCPGQDPSTCFLQHNKTDREGDFEHINCAWVLDYARPPSDGFPNMVVACFIIFYGGVTFMDEVYEDTVKHLMTHLDMMHTLWGRGLFYLFMSSVVMTHSSTMLMACGSMVMALAFLYILLFFLVEFSPYGDYLGFRKPSGEGGEAANIYSQTSPSDP